MPSLRNRRRRCGSRWAYITVGCARHRAHEADRRCQWRGALWAQSTYMLHPSAHSAIHRASAATASRCAEHRSRAARGRERWLRWLRWMSRLHADKGRRSATSEGRRSAASQSTTVIDGAATSDVTAARRSKIGARTWLARRGTGSLLACPVMSRGRAVRALGDRRGHGHAHFGGCKRSWRRRIGCGSRSPCSAGMSGARRADGELMQPCREGTPCRCATESRTSR